MECSSAVRKAVRSPVTGFFCFLLLKTKPEMFFVFFFLNYFFPALVPNLLV